MPTIALILSVFALLLSHSHTRGAVLINDPLLTQPGAGLNTSAPPSNQLPTCVNSIAHPNWTGAFYPFDCNDAYQSIRDQVQENLQTPYNFYSQQAFPRRDQRPQRGWPLPQGSSSGAALFLSSKQHVIQVQTFRFLKLLQIPAPSRSVWPATSVPCPSRSMTIRTFLRSAACPIRPIYGSRYWQL